MPEILTCPNGHSLKEDEKTTYECKLKVDVDGAKVYLLQQYQRTDCLTIYVCPVCGVLFVDKNEIQHDT